MARSRNIKPGFFFNTDLADIEPLGRLLFIGLWTIADREGRLQDCPRKIKAQVLPYDDVEIGELLSELEVKGFVQRYEVKGSNYIQIENWHKHQNPHHMEVPSEIPAPKGAKNKYNHRPVTKKQRERIFKRDNYGCVICGNSADLSIDHIIPVSKGGTSDDENLRTLCGLCNGKKGNREQIVNGSSTVSGRADNGKTTHADSLNPLTDSFNLIIESFNRECPSLPCVMRLTERRKKILRARLKEYPPERLTEAFKKVTASSFLAGENDRGWRADFDWILNENNLVKILEGKYDDKKEAQAHGRARTSTEFDTEFAGIYE
ncbi:MAG: HNH endonuclease signature motif containing protein [Actinomycetota bacterium]|nr:HNH endonuclease signature motif containing protein [Actinomycetota bacterium]